MKRNLILATSVVITIGTISYVTIKSGLVSKISSFFIAGTTQGKLPSFTFSTLETEEKINTDDLKPGGSFVILYFSPDCPFCKEQLHEIIKNNTALVNVPIYFLSPFTNAEIKPYFKGYNLSAYKNIVAGVDNSSSFGKYYKVGTVPCLAFFDKNRDLKDIRVGITGSKVIKSICDSINQFAK
jgi:thiol-disulfide isomerase/thioredoxin